jgi:polyvinyl alcohol dehydrogenase (cytochrome)
MKQYLAVLTIAFGSLLSVAISKAQWPDNENFAEWPVAGQNPTNSRSQPFEYKIDKSNVGQLAARWVFTTGSGVSATPTVAEDAVYFPDWAGNLYAVDKRSGRQIWSHQISEYDGVPGATARVSPAVHGDELILGDIENGSKTHAGANVIAVDRKSGALRWITQVDSHPSAIITGSAVVFRDVVYQGVSSIEEGLATHSAYPCCTFRGSMVALNAVTGAILWKTYDMPDNAGKSGGYSGGAIWQPPAIDPGHGLLYVGTGNNYSVPASVEACEAKAIADHNADADCTAWDDYFDTALALELTTGRARWANTAMIRWARRLQQYDTWTVSCIFGLSSCPSPHGPDYDLGGSGPNFLGNVVGFGEKSGVYWALNPESGRVVWSTAVGPGGPLGGIEWGTATDGRRIYVAIANNSHTSYTLPSGQTITSGSWGALDAATGKILWQTADPAPAAAAIDTGSLSVANGVLYADSLAAASGDSNMFALDTETGRILWNFASGGSVIDGPAIVDGVVYWGSGYPRSGFTGNNKVFAFEIPHSER